MKKLFLAGLMTLGVTAFAANKSINVNIFQDSVVNGKTLKAGDYKVSVENGNAVIKHGKESIVVPAREETEPDKVASTELLYKNGTELEQIRVGGTHTAIVFEPAAATHQGM
jgi:hypothetical protein